MTKQCCVCTKVFEDGAWRYRTQEPVHERISHTYCPVCLQAHLTMLRGDRAAAPVREMAHVTA